MPQGNIRMEELVNLSNKLFSKVKKPELEIRYIVCSQGFADLILSKAPEKEFSGNHCYVKIDGKIILFSIDPRLMVGYESIININGFLYPLTSKEGFVYDVKALVKEKTEKKDK